jgi:hypothetical protein
LGCRFRYRPEPAACAQTMVKTAVATAAAVASALLVGELPLARPEDVFASIDADGSGDISEAELRAHFPGGEVPENLFQAEDADGDGRISFGEFSGPKGPKAQQQGAAGGGAAAAAARRRGQQVHGQGQQGQGGGGGGGGGGAGGASEINLFARLDADGDAFVSKAEFEALIDNPDLWASDDKDKDDRISWQEFGGPKGDRPPPPAHKPRSSAHAERQQPRQPPKQGAGDRNIFMEFDQNGDERVSQLEFFERMPDDESSRLLFQTDDADGDGAISWDEFTGPKGTSQQHAQRLRTVAAVSSSLASVGGGGGAGARAGAGAGTAHAAGGAGEHHVDVFAILDRDGDGVIAFSE